MRRWVVLGLLVLLVAGAAWWAAHALRPPHARLRIGTDPQVISGPLRIAERWGDFASQDLDVTIVSYPSGRQALGALLRREVDLATVAETPLWNQALSPSSIVLWCTLAESRRSVCLVARGDRGVHQVQDLVGKRVGLPRGTTAEVYLLTYLDQFGIDHAQVTMVDVPPQDICGHLAAGDIDVACIWEPLAAKAEACIAHPQVLHEDYLYRMTWNLVGRRDGAALPIERVLRAIDRANQRMLENDPRVVDELTTWCDADRARVARLMPQCHFSLQLEASLQVEVEEQVKLLGGPDATPPDLLALIDPGPLLRVLPEAVSLPGPDAQ
jgi:NitT/TauT family transport system substrate-binding protein